MEKQWNFELKGDGGGAATHTGHKVTFNGPWASLIDENGAHVVTYSAEAIVCFWVRD